MSNKVHKNNLRDERIGATNRNRNGSIMTVVEYKNAMDIAVAFDNDYTTHSTWNAFKRGEVKNVYDRTVYGVGFIGDGPYKSHEGGKLTKQYNAWNAMMNRAYSSKFHQKHTTYKNCSISGEWHNFQAFANWFDANYYEIDEEVMHLDKDILLTGNKCYGPDFCVFVPQRINKLFIKLEKSNNSRPIGVYYNDTVKAYYASINKNGKYIRKTFSTEEGASRFYKETKEAYIRDVAEEYKNKIPNKLYIAMLNYKVCIDD